MKKLLFISTFLAICSHSFSQDGLAGALTNGIYLHPTQLIFPEVILTYEHFGKKDRKSMSYSLGYKIPVGKGSTFEPFGHGAVAIYEMQYIFNPFSQAVFASVARSYYFGHNRNYFLQAELFNRFYWLNNKQLSFDNVETDQFNSIRTERNNVTGLRILIGRVRRLNIGASHTLITKFHFGPGLRVKVYEYENVDNRVEQRDGSEVIVPYSKESGTKIYPSLNIGIKIGLIKKPD